MAILALYGSQAAMSCLFTIPEVLAFVFAESGAFCGQPMQVLLQQKHWLHHSLPMIKIGASSWMLDQELCPLVPPVAALPVAWLMPPIMSNWALAIQYVLP